MKTRYYVKRPSQPFRTRLIEGKVSAEMMDKRHWTTSLAAAQHEAEQLGRPGYTSEPWYQLIEVSSDPTDGKVYHRVLAEHETGRGWTDALTAAGFISRAV